MTRYSVIAPALNIRSTASSSSPANIIGRIPFQGIVEVLDRTTPGWWKVKVVLTQLEGYVASRYLIAEDDQPIFIDKKIDKAEFKPHPRARLTSKAKPAWPIGGSDVPYRNMKDIASKLASIGQIIKVLDVEQSQRYQRTKENTFCNVYAYDFCHFAKTYIPRVWWTEKAIDRLRNGEKIELLYGITAREYTANLIHDWFLDWGREFAWEKIPDVHTLQQMVNSKGGVGILCAKRRETRKSGHITVVVPETESEKAIYQNGQVIIPLQSQAGAVNFNYFSEEAGMWWQHERFSSFIFYYHA